MLKRSTISLCTILLFQTLTYASHCNAESSFRISQILKTGIQVAHTIQNKRDKIFILKDIGIAQAKTGEIQDAWQIEAKIPKNFNNDQGFNKNAVLSAIAIAQAKYQKIEDALHTVEKISRKIERETTLSNIAIAQAEAGDIKQGLRIAESISKDNSYWKDYAFLKIGETQAQQGDIAGGIQTALKVADHFQHALWNIVRQLVEEDNLKGAKEVIANLGNSTTVVTQRGESSWHR